MAGFLLWKERVAHNLALAMVVTCLAVVEGASQMTNPDRSPLNLSISVSNQPFREVIAQLSKKTGLNFVYSSDKIPVAKSVSLSVRNQSLETILSMLSAQTDLIFKRKDHFVVIKTKPKAPPHEPAYASSKPLREYSVSIPKTTQSINTERAFDGLRYDKAPLAMARIKNQFSDITPYFDTSRIPDVPLKYVQRLNMNDRHPGWFVSGGLVINEYSAGVELQAGIRQVYLVYSPTLLKSGQFHGSYGIGTSVQLKHNLSFQPGYMYSVTKRGEERMAVETFSSDDLNFVARQHQVKFMMQYSITSQTNVKLGMTLSSLTTKYYVRDPNYTLFVSRTVTYAGTGNVALYASPGLPGELPATPPLPATFQTFKMWAGWEASISYRINFSKTK